MIARRLRIHGRVQGVFYRQWTIGTASELGLTGWVRNRDDGTVEAQVQGDESRVEALIEAAVIDAQSLTGDAEAFDLILFQERNIHVEQRIFGQPM